MFTSFLLLFRCQFFSLSFSGKCIVNVFRACVGLPPENFMLLEHKVIICRSPEHPLVSFNSSSYDFRFRDIAANIV